MILECKFLVYNDNNCALTNFHRVSPEHEVKRLDVLNSNKAAVLVLQMTHVQNSNSLLNFKYRTWELPIIK